MKRIKNYFAAWDVLRCVKLGLGLILTLLYAFEGLGIYLIFSVFLIVQAVMNIGCGCCAGSCSTNINSKQETPYKIEELNTEIENV